MTHVVLLTLGSRGDLQPLVALAIHYKMKYSQHRFTIVAPIQLHSLYKDLYDVYDIAAQGVIQANSKAERLIETKQIWQLCQRLQPSLLLYTTFVLEGWSIAEKLDIPSVVISLFPLHLYPIPSTFEEEMKNEFAEFYATTLKDIWYPHIHHWMWRLFLEDQGDFREYVLDLDPIPYDIAQRIPPFIYAIDPDLLCLSNSYNAHPCGFWALLQTQKLITTVKRSVLLINFGSMDTLSIKLLKPYHFLLQINSRLNQILKAFDQFDIIWIISSQDVPLYTQFIPCNSRIEIMTAIEHDILVKKYHVIGMIHHGGIGTCSTMIQLGVPQAILPFLFDQYYWADKLESIGLSKTLNINQPWINTIEWMLDTCTHTSAIQYWRNKLYNNTIEGLNDAIRVLSQF